MGSSAGSRSFVAFHKVTVPMPPATAAAVKLAVAEKHMAHPFLY
jgi:hypothetical protein